MTQLLWVVIIGGCLGLTGCMTLLAPFWPSYTTIHGLTPVHPHVGGRVESLRPTFRWEPPAHEPDVAYDLIIYESLLGVLGKEVYFREGLTNPEHQVEEPLRPNTLYYWSVRVRRGGQVSDWSRFDVTAVGLPGKKSELPFFIFKTPEKP